MKLKKGKRFLSLILAFAVLGTALCMNASAAQAQAAVKYSFGFSWVNHISPRQYYVGDKNEWNDYGMNSTEAFQLTGTAMNISLNDPGFNPASKAGEIRTEEYTGKDWNDADWGWTGLGFGYMTGTQNLNDVPDEYWGDVLDISDSVNSGYAVFEIDVTNAAGIDSAYFTITAASNEWAVPGAGENGDAITRENYPGLRAQQHYCTLVSGEKITDYYDVNVGGKQLIKIPLSKFTDGEGFMDSYGKNWGAQTGATVSQWTRLNPKLFSGMGIARKISSSATPLGFSASVTAMAIVAPEAPTELSAVRKADGSIDIDFIPTGDNDVTYKVVRRSGSDVQYFEAPDATYNDKTANPARSYTYSAVAVDNMYGIMSAESNSVTFEAETGLSEFYEDFKLEDIYESTEVVGNLNYETWPSPLAVGPYKEGVTDVFFYDHDYMTHAVNGVFNAKGRPRTYYIHDMYYNGTQEASITYRTDKYEKEIGQLWGFNGVRYRNQKVPKSVKDFSAIKDTGYAIFDIKLESGSETAGAYLALMFVNENLMPYMGQDLFYNFIGVPLANYYDAQKGGYQQIAVPLSDFDVENENNFATILDVGGRHTLDREALNMAAFHGMGIIRTDSRGSEVYNIEIDKLSETAKPFAYTANRLALVNVEAPSGLEAMLGDNGVLLSWNASETRNVSKYEIFRNGEKIAELNDELSYTDSTAAPGRDYTYGVRAISPSYPNAYSVPETAAISIPSGTTVKLYAGSGDNKRETKYTSAGTMSAEFSGAKENLIGYIARYDAQNKLVNVVAAEVAAGSPASVEITDCLATDTIKAFIWSAGLQPKAEMKTAVPKTVKKVLVIGDSYSADATAYLNQISDGKIDAEVLVNDTDFAGHWNNIKNSAAVYSKNGTENVSVNNAIASDEWDVVVLQENPLKAADDNATFQPELGNIMNFVRQNAPGAQIMLHETWEFKSEYIENNYPDLVDGEAMWTIVKENYTNAAGSSVIIPVGTAIRNLINDNANYDIWSDGQHLKTPEGSYLAGLVWYMAITGGDIEHISYNAGIDENTVNILKTAARAAF